MDASDDVESVSRSHNENCCKRSRAPELILSAMVTKVLPFVSALRCVVVTCSRDRGCGGNISHMFPIMLHSSLYRLYWRRVGTWTGRQCGM